MDYHFLPQGILLTQGSNPCLSRFLHWHPSSLGRSSFCLCSDLEFGGCLVVTIGEGRQGGSLNFSSCT